MQSRELVTDWIMCNVAQSHAKCFYPLPSGTPVTVSMQGEPEFSDELSSIKGNNYGTYAIAARSSENLGKIKCTIDGDEKLHCEPFHYVFHDQSPRHRRRG